MAKGENAAGHNKDLWKPGPLSTYPHDADTKRMARRISRRTQKQALKHKKEDKDDERV